MPWEDRLREAAYTPPSGDRLVFQYTDVTTSTPKRTTIFNFPGVNGAYIQDNGHGARAFPLRCFFSGDDHDIEASAFEVALLERGVGRLEHPFYGTFDVVPTGSIKRRDDLRSAANQTIIEVRFSTSLAAVYPQNQTDLASEVLAAVDALGAAAGQQFEDSTDLSTVAAKEKTKAETTNAITAIRAALSSAAAATSETEDAFNDALTAIEDSLDTLIDTPAALATALFEATLIPAAGTAEIDVRLAGYAALADAVSGSAAANPADAFQLGVVLPQVLRSVANDFHVAALTLWSAVAGSVVSVVENQFAARPDATAAADAVLVEFDDAVIVLDAGYATLAAVDAPGGIDTGEAYQALQDAVALAAGFLIEISFTLLPERRLVLDRPRTILDLSAELYGDISDAQLDILIDNNDLSGSEILEIPRGREVVYYA